MRVLAISHNYPHKDGPTCGVFAQLQLCGVAKLGAEIDVWVPLAFAPKVIAKTNRYKLFRNRELLQFEGVNAELFRYLKLPGSWFHRWAGLAGYLAIKQVIKSLHKIKPYDVMYAIGFFPEADIAVRLKKLLGIPVVALAIGSDINIVPNISNLMNNHYVKICNSLDSILTCGAHLANQISSVTERPTKPVFGLVDMEVFKPVDREQQLNIRKELDIKTGNKLILFVGNIIKTKGIYELMSTFANIAKERADVSLIICGDGAESSRLKEMIAAQDLSRQITLVGPVQHSQMHKWMQASDMLVLPSYMEGVPNVVMEAMSCGLPVVTTEVGGLPSAVGDSKGAILVPPKNVAVLGNAITKILNSPTMEQEMKMAARETAIQRFDIIKNVNNVMGCFKEVLACKWV